jgi:hypothetical protein
MSSRKITFKEPEPWERRPRHGISTAGDGAVDPVGTGAEGPHRVRAPSPYPRYIPDDESELLSRVALKVQSSASAILSLGCFRSETDSDIADEGDESLQRYKQSLGLGGGTDLSDPNDPRVCIIQSLTMESPGRDPVVIDLTAPGSVDNLKKTPFKIKEGATFTMTAHFKVQHEILSGLHYVQVIKRKGIRIPGGKSDEMIVSRTVFLFMTESAC